MKRLWFFSLCAVALLNIFYGDEWKRTLSTSPRIYYISQFLSFQECDSIIEQARPFLVRSTVLSAKGGDIDSRRSSSGMFFSSNPSDILLCSLERKISDLTQMPIENGEGLQVLCYQKGGEYQPHYDYFNSSQPGGAEALGRGGQRVATVMVYLNDPEKGGETIFPMANISVVPKKGDALMFYNVTTEGIADTKSLHGGAPVLEGEKWIITKWIRERVFH